MGGNHSHTHKHNPDCKHYKPPKKSDTDQLLAEISDSDIQHALQEPASASPFVRKRANALKRRKEWEKRKQAKKDGKRAGPKRAQSPNTTRDHGHTHNGKECHGHGQNEQHNRKHSHSHGRRRRGPRRLDPLYFNTKAPSPSRWLAFTFAGILATNIIIDHCMPLEDRVTYYRAWTTTYRNGQITLYLYSLYIGILGPLMYRAGVGSNWFEIGAMGITIGNWKYFQWANHAADLMCKHYETNKTEAINQSGIAARYNLMVFTGFILAGVFQINFQPTKLHCMAYIGGCIFMEYFFSSLMGQNHSLLIVFMQAELTSMSIWPYVLKWMFPLFWVMYSVIMQATNELNCGRVFVTVAWVWMLWRLSTSTLPAMQTIAHQPRTTRTGAFNIAKDAVHTDTLIFLAIIVICLVLYMVDPDERVEITEDEFKTRFNNLSETEKDALLLGYEAQASRRADAADAEANGELFYSKKTPGKHKAQADSGKKDAEALKPDEAGDTADKKRGRAKNRGRKTVPKNPVPQPRKKKKKKARPVAGSGEDADDEDNAFENVD